MTDSTETVSAPSQTALLWEELKLALAAVEKDAVKNLERHNASAGVRFRKSLRHARAVALQLVKATTEADKVEKRSRKATKAAKAASATAE